MNLLSIKWLLSFLTLSIVEGDVSSELIDESGVDEEVSASDEAWNAIENEDVSVDAETKEESAEVSDEIPVDETEKPVEEVKAEEEQKPEGITEDDLKPLESKNAATNERFQKITEGYKAEKDRAELLAQENEKFKGSFESLKQLGFNDETAANDLVEFSAYRHVLATGDAEQFAGIIAQQIKQFELAHGKKVNVNVNSLEAYPDLNDKVSNLELDENTAIEVARVRDIEARANRDNKRQTELIQTEQQKQEVITDAISAVQSLQGNWLKTDPDYNAILPHLQPLMAEIGENFPPHLWASTIDIQYKSLKKALASTVRAKTNEAPLRGNGYMSGRPAPQSTQEATLAAMGFDND